MFDKVYESCSTKLYLSFEIRKDLIGETNLVFIMCLNQILINIILLKVGEKWGRGSIFNQLIVLNMCPLRYIDSNVE